MGPLGRWANDHLISMCSSRSHRPNPVDALTLHGEGGGNGIGLIGRNGRHHANATVKHPKHLLRIDLTLGLNPLHHRGLWPGVWIDFCQQVPGQNPGQVSGDAPAGNMRQGVHGLGVGLKSRKHRFDIDSRGRHYERIERLVWAYTQGGRKSH